ncbi:MAG: efflux RND transporter periplasmic adaptor subunit [Bacteroidales bacterium]|nr:efflux RND transporter periplasmic adaptor subunit [Bacteroidales bacterium]MDP3003073.1 efflux RND transporter periplasmic adaptor subunit [Bacteroidales bacterium]
MKKLKYKVSMVFLGVIVSLSSCTMFNEPVAEVLEVEVLPEDIVELRDDQIKLAGIQTGSVEMRSVSNTLKVNGIISVAPQNQATVCMPLGGFIKSTSLLPGNAVNKGQTLAVMENQDFVDIQQNYLEAKNKLVFAEAEYKRHTDLYKDDVYSEKNVQQVTVDYKNLKALVKSLEQKLYLIGINPDRLTEDNISNTVNLVSPIKGFLKAVNVNIGKYVSPTDVLFEIVNSDKLFLELTLFEKDAEKVVAGQKIKFFVNNGDDVHEAVITQTGKVVSEDKTFIVYASVVSACKNVLPGMYVNALIEESDKKVTALPSEAVVSFDDKDYIFVFEKNKEEAGKAMTEYKIFQVKKGVSSSGYTEITLPEGFDFNAAKVVIKGAYNLLSAKKNAGEMAC